MIILCDFTKVNLIWITKKLYNFIDVVYNSAKYNRIDNQNTHEKCLKVNKNMWVNKKDALIFAVRNASIGKIINEFDDPITWRIEFERNGIIKSWISESIKKGYVDA